MAESTGKEGERRAVVWAETAAERRVAGRTARSLAEAGYRVEVTCDPRALTGPLVFARAGAWLLQHTPLTIPEMPGLLALGSGGGAEWERVLRRTGGDFRRWRKAIPFTPILHISEAAALARELAAGRKIDETLTRLARSGAWRVVRLAALDAAFSPAVRVLQVVTTIQTGGAEKITLDLAAELNRTGTATAVAALGEPTRLAYSEPPFFAGPRRFRVASPEGRAAAVRDAALEWGADLVHAHLLRGTDIHAIRATGWPVVVTAHNAREGWPAGLLSCEADLILACSRAVERDLRAAGVESPVRTVWNGIVPSAHAPNARLRAAGAAPRTALGIPPDAKVLASVANPRRQKRLDRLPDVMALLPGVHLVLAGAVSRGFETETEALRAEFEARGLAPWTHWLGAVDDVPAVLAAADALISVSEWEGLSLAHLEALAAGLPVIATDAGGTREIAARHAGLRLLPVDADAESLAAAARESLAAPAAAGAVAFPAAFTRYTMTRRVVGFYQRVLAPRPTAAGETRTLWLVTNNFSTGGAQTSARRLLLALRERGIDARAVVVQENPRRPTPGRAALLAAGVPVFCAPPPETADAAEACAAVMDDMDGSDLDGAGKRTVVFWNLLTAHKLFLADALWDWRVIDVSPGAMFYSSLERYFLKPRADLPYGAAAEYGALLNGVVVKYEREAAQATSFLGAPVTVISNGVPLPLLPARLRKPGAPLVLATAARLSPDKRLDQLLAALRLAAPELPRWKLRVAGGTERDHRGHAKELRKLARGLPVEWCGVLADTTAFLAAADVFVMISEPPGCPNASLEALAAGLPVIATDVGGAGEQIIDGVTGLLVPPGDAPALAAAIVRLARDLPLRGQLAAAGRAHVAERFSMERMTRAYEAVFFPGE